MELHRYNLGMERKTPAPGHWPRRIRRGARGLRPPPPTWRSSGSRACSRCLMSPGWRPAITDPPPDSIVTSIGIDLGTELAGWSSRIVETLSFELNDSREQRPFLITEKIPEHGRSGGGLFLANGELVGVCVGHAELVPGRRLGVFASRESIRFLLDDHKLTAAIVRSESRRARLSGRPTRRSEIVRRPAELGGHADPVRGAGAAITSPGAADGLYSLSRAVESSSGGTGGGRMRSRRFLGVRISIKRKPMVRNPKIAGPRGWTSRNVISDRTRQSTNPVVKMMHAGLV